MVDSPKKCIARGGSWENNRCSIPEGETSQGTLPLLPATTPREQQQREAEQAAIRANEARDKAAREKAANEAAREAALDQPIGTTINPITTAGGGQVGGDGRTVQDGIPGVIENGVFFADEPNRTDKIIFDEAGNPVGVEKAGGRTLLGLSPQDVASVAGNRIIGAEEAAQAKSLQRQLEGFGLSASEIAEIEAQVSGEGEAPINWSQAIAAGTIGNLGRIATYAAGGAIASAGNPIASIVGAAAAVWSGIQSDIKRQQSGEIGASKDVLSNAKTNMMKLSRLAMTDPSHATEYMSAYNFWEGKVYGARRKIQLETQGDLNAWMEDGRDILSDFDLFLMKDVGTAAIYKQRIIAALQNDIPIEMQIAQMLETE